MSGGGEGHGVWKSVQEKEIHIKKDITETNGLKHRKLSVKKDFKDKKIEEATYVYD